VTQFHVSSLVEPCSSELCHLEVEKSAEPSLLRQSREASLRLLSSDATLEHTDVVNLDQPIMRSTPLRVA